MFDDTNEVVKTFRTTKDKHESSQVVDMCIRLIGNRERVARQYNLPTSKEISGLMIGNNGDDVSNRDFIVQLKSGMLQRVNELHPSYMAMQYPILFPYGKDSFTIELPYTNISTVKIMNKKNMSIREYYAFRIHYRNNEGHALIIGGRLYQQYIMDVYTCIEERRLSYIRSNQSDLRSELYQRLSDAIVKGDDNATFVGKRIVLPASFIGDPRYMVQTYQDAIAICRWAGCPDLFITTTCKTKWPEIEKALHLIPDQKAEVDHILFQEYSKLN